MIFKDEIEWIADVFEMSVNEISSEMKREDIEAWDSLGTLTLMSRLDEDFEILLSEDEIQNLRSVKDIIEILRTHKVFN